MIEDELLEMQINKADHKERVALLKHKADLKQKRIQDYKQRLIADAKAQDHVVEAPKINSRLASINFSQNL